MPYPSQINREIILETARALIEAGGADTLSLHQLAAALHVKAPSLYRYFANKTDLLQAINTTTVEQLSATLRAATASDAPAAERLLAMGHAYRDFAHAHPAAYLLMYTNTQAELRPDDALLHGLALPLQSVFAELCGVDHALFAMGGAWALLHGFVTLEINQQFRRMRDTDSAFETTLTAYLAGWQNTV